MSGIQEKLPGIEECKQLRPMKKEKNQYWNWPRFDAKSVTKVRYFIIYKKLNRDMEHIKVQKQN